MFSYEFCKVSKNTFFTEHLWMTASVWCKTELDFWFKKCSSEATTRVDLFVLNETPEQALSCEFFKDAFLTEHLQATASVFYQVLIFRDPVLVEDLDALKWDWQLLISAGTSKYVAPIKN